MTDTKTPSQYLYVFPAQMQKYPDVPQLVYEAPIVNGFSQNFTAMLVKPDTGENKNVSGQTSCIPRDIPPEQGGGGKVHVVYEGVSNWFSVTGTVPGAVWLDFSHPPKKTNETKESNESFTTSVLVVVDNSDLLLYAPDGMIYQVPVSVWKGNAAVKAYALQNMTPPIQTMLNSNVSLANLPHLLPPPASRTGEASAAGPSENITCYLVNLNSLLLANPKAMLPPTPLTEGSGSTPPASPPSDDTKG